LWEARTKIPAADQAKFDAALYKAMRAHPNDGNLGYEDLAQLFVTQLNTDFPAGAKALTDALTGRGVLPGCERILEVTTDAAKAPGGEGAIGGFASPGKQTLGSSGDLAPGIVQVHTKLAPNTVKAKITFTAKAQSAGGGGIFGGGGKPFAPVVIVKANQAITWTTKGKLAHDGDAALDPTAAGSSYTAELDVAAGSTDLYVQIANKGDTDGTYDSIAIKTEQGPAPPDDNGNKPPTNGNPPGAGNNDSSGCSCTTTGAGGTGGGVALGLGAALGLALVLRRRKPR
jgi:MYXO-CTERM domain-containing protein